MSPVGLWDPVPDVGRRTASWITTRTARSAVRKCETLPKGPALSLGEQVMEKFSGRSQKQNLAGHTVGELLGTDTQDLCSSEILCTMPASVLTIEIN